MSTATSAEPDLMPPAFAEGLDDWSSGDGTPDSPTYAGSGQARLARDPDFDICLELRTEGPVQRLRYMGEVPVPTGICLAVEARLKVLRGPLPVVRVAAWPGGRHGRPVAGLPSAGPAAPIASHGVVVGLRAVIGPAALDGVDLVWDARVLYAHVGLDLLGLRGTVVRVESLVVRAVADGFGAGGRMLPGQGPEPVRS